MRIFFHVVCSSQQYSMDDSWPKPLYVIYTLVLALDFTDIFSTWSCTTRSRIRMSTYVISNFMLYPNCTFTPKNWEKKNNFSWAFFFWNVSLQTSLMMRVFSLIQQSEYIQNMRVVQYGTRILRGLLFIHPILAAFLIAFFLKGTKKSTGKYNFCLTTVHNLVVVIFVSLDIGVTNHFCQFKANWVENDLNHLKWTERFVTGNDLLHISISCFCLFLFYYPLKKIRKLNGTQSSTSDQLQAVTRKYFVLALTAVCSTFINSLVYNFLFF